MTSPRYLAQQKKAHPDLAQPLDELDAFAKVIDTRIAARSEKIKTPDEAAAMIEAFKKDGLDDVSAGRGQEMQTVYGIDCGDRR